MTGNGTGVNTGNYGLSVDFNGNALSGGQIYTASGQVTGAGTGTGFTAAENALVNGKSYNIAGAPLHFVRSGYTNRSNGSVQGAGFYNLLWSSTSSPYFRDGTSGLTAFSLSTVTSTVNTANGPYSRWDAYPIRCLAY